MPAETGKLRLSNTCKILPLTAYPFSTWESHEEAFFTSPLRNRMVLNVTEIVEISAYGGSSGRCLHGNRFADISGNMGLQNNKTGEQEFTTTEGWT